MATIERTHSHRPQLSLPIDRQLPQNLDAEKSVLGSILLLPEVADEVALIVQANDFYGDANRTIYEHLLAMHDGGKSIDPMLLVESLRRSEQYEAIGGAAYLAEIGQMVPTAAHAEYYAHIVAEKAVLRSLIHAGTDIVHDAFDPLLDYREAMSRAEQRIFGILEGRGSGEVRGINDVLHDSLERIDARLDREHAFGGLETGFDDFDQLTGGLHNSELIILAARPSMGKTALAMNIAEHVATIGKSVLFVSLEMSAIELADRLLCSRAKVNSKRLRTGTIGKEERRKIVEAAGELNELSLHIDESPNRTMTEIAANARRLKRKGSLDLIVIDYLQLIDPDNARDPRQEQVAKITRRLKGLARELKIPVLCLAQLNRQVEASRDNKPQLSHLRESGAIEQDADVVMFVHREEYYATKEEDRELYQGQAELLVRKQRNGPIGDIKLAWLNDFTRFANWSHLPHQDLMMPGDEGF